MLFFIFHSIDSIYQNLGHNLPRILDSLNKLKINTQIELMLKKESKDNINLVDEIQNNQLICLYMPGSMLGINQKVAS